MPPLLLSLTTRTSVPPPARPRHRAPLPAARASVRFCRPMSSRVRTALALGAIALASLAPLRAPAADAAAAAKGAPKPTPKERWSLAPLPPGLTAVATHAPYASGDCSICHKNADPKAPGPVAQ